MSYKIFSKYFKYFSPCFYHALEVRLRNFFLNITNFPCVVSEDNFLLHRTAMNRDKLEALHYYAKIGNYLRVQSLVSEGVDPDGKNTSGKTPLMLALQYSQIEVVNILINSGADINFSCCQDPDHQHLLHYASYKGWAETVQSLINRGVSVDSKNLYGRTPLMLAAKWLRKETVECLVKCRADIHCCDNNRWTALHYASCGTSVEIVQLLANEGVALNVKTSDGQTPLILAVKYSNKESVECLIKNRADIYCRDDNGWTALHHAACGTSLEMVKLLANEEVALNIKTYEGQTPVMLASNYLRSKILEHLINCGANIYDYDLIGWTVLHHASYEGSVYIAQCLLNKGFDINMKNFYGRTSLMLAANRSHRAVFELLINSGADIHISDNNGWTVLHHVSSKGQVNFVLSLLSAGVSLNVRNSDGQTPLMLAAQGSYREVVELLINCGEDVHSCDDNSWTALHYASCKGSVDIVHCLVNKGFALEKKNCCGKTPLLLAAEWSHRQVVELLIKLRADIHCCDNYGWTLLHIASLEGWLEMVQCLVTKRVVIDKTNSHGRTPLHLAIQMNETVVADYLINAGADCNVEDNYGESPFNLLIRGEMPNVKTIKLCIEKGAFLKSSDPKLLEHPLLKKVLFQDMELCSQAVINKFNNKDLPLFYECLAFSKRLPHIDKLKIQIRSKMALVIKQCVTNEIQTKGFCNLFEMVPLVLGILCLKSPIEKSIPAINQDSLESQIVLDSRLFYRYSPKKPCKKCVLGSKYWKQYF